MSVEEGYAVAVGAGVEVEKAETKRITVGKGSTERQSERWW